MGDLAPKGGLHWIPPEGSGLRDVQGICKRVVTRTTEPQVGSYCSYCRQRLFSALSGALLSRSFPDVARNRCNKHCSPSPPPLRFPLRSFGFRVQCIYFVRIQRLVRIKLEGVPAGGLSAPWTASERCSLNDAT